MKLVLGIERRERPDVTRKERRERPDATRKERYKYGRKTGENAA